MSKDRQKKERFTFLRLPTRANVCFGEGVNLHDLARLTMLSTYAQYSEYPDKEDSVLLVGHTKSQRPMDKKDMCDILRLSRQTFNVFFTDVTENGMLLSLEDGSFAVNSSFFFRGKLSHNPSGRYAKGAVAKVFSEKYRLLFYSNLKNIKEIGLVLRLIPFINRHYDVLCHDPYESNVGMVRGLTVTDICRLVGMSAGNVTRYRKRLEEKFADITYEYNGVMHSLCTIRQNEKRKSSIYVSPGVISF